MNQKSSYERDTLDQSSYNLEGDSLAFYETLTGLKGDDLKTHVFDVQCKAYRIFPYPCIGGLRFLLLKAAGNPIYPAVLKLCRSQKDAIFLDLGCCFGVDPRKAVYDGISEDQVLGSDLLQEFIDLGYELFRDREKSRIKFIAGDIFNPKFLDITADEGLPSSPVPLTELSDSLQPLLHSISSIHAGSLFHLFDEPTQFKLAEQMAFALSTRSGATIFGSHGALPKKGIRANLDSNDSNPSDGMFCHSPESWTEMWRQVWEKHGSDKLGGKWEDLEVRAELRNSSIKAYNRAVLEHSGEAVGGSNDTIGWHVLVWSLRRK